MVVLLVVVYLVCRSRETPVAVSVAVAGAVVASPVTFFAGTTIYGDLLSTVLQLAAVAVTLRRTDRPSAAVSVALAALVLVIGLWRRRLELLDLAFLLCGLLTLVVLTDVGTGFNHLLDLAVLTPLVVATAFGRWRTAAPRLALAAVAVLPLATAAGAYPLRHDVRETAGAALDRTTVERWREAPLRDRLDGSYFTEDPMVAVENGDRPVALDSFMLLRLAREHPEWEQQLVDRFDRREFDTVVLIVDLDLDDPWWSRSYLGLTLAGHRSQLRPGGEGAGSDFRLPDPDSAAVAAPVRAADQAGGRPGPPRTRRAGRAAGA